MSSCITPSLFLGPPEAASFLTDLYPVTTVDGAVAVIEDGRRALLPEDAWDAAAEVLARLGLPPDQVAERLRFAKTGKL